jgi:hypothetical protein
MAETKITETEHGTFLAKLPGIFAILLLHGEQWEVGQFNQDAYRSRADVEREIMTAFPDMRWSDAMHRRQN